MTGKMLLLSVLLVGAVTVVRSNVDTIDKAKAYLKQYGYMKNDDDSDMTDAMKHFQYMANITMTGMLDEDTMMMMDMPRCGVADVLGQAGNMRKRRYTLGVNGRVFRWPRTDLTYRIDSRTPDITDPNDVDRTMEAALQVWSDVTPLTFRRVFGTTPADIIITFDRLNHGDGNDFDGPGRVLAHAYFPTNGDAHFDEDERWTINTFQGTNLFQVAAHEFGHSLGLGHSTIDAALMAPFYRGYVPNFQLHSDDIAGIRQLYGENTGRPVGTMPPTDDSCTGIIDAVTSTLDRHTYFFEGSMVWKREFGLNRIANGFPKPIGTVFAGLPNNVDAAIYSRGSGRTYIFKGAQYWRYRNEVLDSGFPRSISQDWPGLPNDLDAAFVWSGNNRWYFIKGNQYYRFSRNGVDSGYPRPLSVWRIPGNQVGAAFQYTENLRTYFFNGNGDYFLFNDTTFMPASGFPQPVAPVWQGCVSNLETDDDSGVSGLVPSILVLLISMVVGACQA